MNISFDMNIINTASKKSFNRNKILLININIPIHK